MNFGKLKLKRCRHGWMLFAGPVIGKCFDLYGEYSESEIAMMRAFLPPGGTAIDVGANIGDLTVPLSAIVGDTGRVIAVESHPEVFNILCANLALNGITNTLPINAFIARDGSVDTGSKAWGKTAYVGDRWPTRFIALDDLDLAALDLVKIDVDGKELEVLQSGAMQIERFRPAVYFENDDRDASPALIEFLLRDLGYDLYWHLAPVFDPDNFFGNPVNAWAPNDMVSIMVIGVPGERKFALPNLRRITSRNDWWQDQA
ncbi:MAG: FkbM family methyltransferase [Burkholderiales bacterium]